MSVWFVQGKLGSGKGITSIGRIKTYLARGAIVATNMDLFLDHLVGPFDKKSRVMRLPDQPRLQDLQHLGFANLSYDEGKNGLIVLDECATWFNSRSWNDKTRAGVIDWLVHCRKLGWDLIIQIQDVSAVDSQARSLIMEHVATCLRTDKMNIPIIGFFYGQIMGKKMPLPKVHIAKVIYTATDTFSERWTASGSDLYLAYDTKQIFSPGYIAANEASGVAGVYSYLPPWYWKGQFLLKHDWDFFMRLSRIYFTKLRLSLAFIAGCILAAAVTLSIAIMNRPVPVAVVPPVETRIFEKPLPPLPDLFTVSTVDIAKAKGRYDQFFYASEKLTDGNRIYYLADFLARGFQHKFFTHCYQELTSLEGVTTSIYCQELETPEFEENKDQQKHKNVFTTDDEAA